jgi:hypothetical protein
MNKYLVVLCGLFSSLAGLCQTDNAGSGRAIRFDGIDDYVDLGNIYDNLALPVTLSVWVYTDPSISTLVPIFDSQDGSSVYNGVALVTSHQHVGMTYGDGLGGNNPAYRRSKAALMNDPTGKWMNIAVVFKGKTNMDIYVNGVNMGGSYEGYSDAPMNSNSPSEVAKLGYWFSNGTYYRFKGIMDEFRVWNRALSETEIRDTMCKKLQGNETGLIGYWNFDETTGSTVFDKSSNGFNGALIGSPERVYSSAPIGDVSAYLYPGSWTGNSVTLTYGTDRLKVSNVLGSPSGIQVYAVNSLPSQTGGLAAGEYDKPYMGVFAATLNSGVTFDAAYTDNNVAVCAKQRTDNSVDTWINQSLTGILQRTELMKYQCCVALDVDLGADHSLCDNSSYTLQAPAQFSGMDFLWSTGATTSSITVSTSGEYWLKVGDCNLSRDTVAIDFQHSPSSFSLGQDENLCTMNARFLNPFTAPPADYDFTWQDGSKNQGMLVNNFGKYWLKVKNSCGSFSDTVTFSKISEGTIKVDLGTDKQICGQTNTTLSLPADLANKTILWSTGSTLPSIVVTASQNYSVKVSGACQSDADTVAVSFIQPPPVFSLGNDEVICNFEPRKLRPLKEPGGFQFEWQDGSIDSTFAARDFGEYWVKVSNACGTTSDKIKISKLTVDIDKIPNVITPGNDMLNENFVVEANLLGSRFTVFNRWGERVYDNVNYQNNWNGGALPSGVYFYILKNDCIGQVKGHISLVKVD